MMINKRLIGVVPDSKKYIAGNVILQWCSLASNIVLMTSIAALLQGLWSKTAGRAAMSYLSAKGVKCENAGEKSRN